MAGRAAEDADGGDSMSAEGGKTLLADLMRSNPSCTKGEVFVAGALHPHHAHDSRAIHELHAAAEENPSGS